MTRKILVVDDSLTTRSQLVEALTPLSFQVIQAEHGDDGLARLGEHPDTVLVITDVNMPWKDGLEMLAEIRASETLRKIPVIMLTTEGNPEEIKRAKQLGIRAWLMKPFKPESLQAVVNKILA